MKVLGLDLGSKTLGIAISDKTGLIATPLEVKNIRNNHLHEAVEYVKMIVAEHHIKKIVLGLPKNMDGSIGSQGKYSLEFKKMLEESITAEVILVDERLTTKLAHSAMLQSDMSRKRRKQNVDKVAASIILQSYLDSKK